MKKIILLAAVAALAGPALANPTAENCKAYVAQNGGDASGCDCLGAAADKNPSLAAALAKIASPADLESADDATKEAIRACFPNSQNPAVKN